MKETKTKLGGRRDNAGRPKGEKKMALGIRVPLQHKEHLEQLVRKELQKLQS